MATYLVTGSIVGIDKGAEVELTEDQARDFPYFNRVQLVQSKASAQVELVVATPAEPKKRGPKPKDKDSE